MNPNKKLTFSKPVTTFVAEIGVPREIHRPVASHWQTLSHNVLLGAYEKKIFWMK
jgi:hypothetical protein